MKKNHVFLSFFSCGCWKKTNCISKNIEKKTIMEIHMNSWKFKWKPRNSYEFMGVHVNSCVFICVHGCSWVFMGVHVNSCEFMCWFCIFFMYSIYFVFSFIFSSFFILLIKNKNLADFFWCRPSGLEISNGFMHPWL